jgi:hypothetical protein
MRGSSDATGVGWVELGETHQWRWGMVGLVGLDPPYGLSIQPTDIRLAAWYAEGSELI